MVVSRQPDRGFTLLEVVLAMGLMAVGLLAVFQVVAQGLDLQAEARFMTLARPLIQERLARVQATEGLRQGELHGGFGTDHPDFRYRLEIREVPEEDRLFRVRVGVFTEGAMQRKELWQETLIYRPRT